MGVSGGEGTAMELQGVQGNTSIGLGMASGLGGVNFPRMMEWSGYLQPQSIRHTQIQEQQYTQFQNYDPNPLKPDTNHNIANPHITLNMDLRQQGYSNGPIDNRNLSGNVQREYGYDGVGNWAENVALVENDDLTRVGVGNGVGLGDEVDPVIGMNKVQDKKRRHVWLVPSPIVKVWLNEDLVWFVIRLSVGLLV